jgi:hypothetical protein
METVKRRRKLFLEGPIVRALVTLAIPCGQNIGLRLVPTQNSECRRNSRISLAFGVLSRDRTVGCVITTGGMCLNDGEKGPIGFSEMIHGAQHAGSVPDAVFWFPRAPKEC